MNWRSDYRAKQLAEEARTAAWREQYAEKCQHAYDVPLLVAVVPRGTACARCGEVYDPPACPERGER